MADNFQAQAVSCAGVTFSSDEICESCTLIHYPEFKVVWGAANTANVVNSTACLALPVQGVACGTAIPVSGTVTANLSCTDNTVLDNIQTAVQVIDNSVYVDDADWTDGSSSHTLVGGLYQSSPQTVTDGDVAPFNITVNGALHTAVQNTVTVTGDCGGSLTVDNAGLTELAAAINACQVDVDLKATDLDLMLGTDFSNVLGTTSLVLATQADCQAITTDGLITSSFMYMFDGTNFDRVRGNTTDGLLVNLGCNNDVTVSGTVTVDPGCNNDVTIDGSAVIQTFDAAADFITCGADTAIAPAFVRDDALSALTPAEGDYVPGFVTQHGALWTALVDACGSQITCFGGSASVYVDDADWTDSTSSHTLVGGLYQSSPQTVTDGDVGPFNMTTNGALHVAQQGTVTVTGDCSGSLTVDGTVAVSSITTSVTPGTGAANLGKAVGNAQGATDTGVAILAVRNDQLADLAGADHDYGPLQLSETGALFVTNVPNRAHASAGDNGLEVHLCLDADETEVQVSANPVLLYGLAFSNSCACNNEFLKLWNAVPACVTVGGACGTAPRIVQMIPKGSAGHISYCPPIYFDTAMSIGAVCTAATTGCQVGATTVVANVFFRDTT